MTTRQTILGSTIRDTLGHYMSSGGGGGGPVGGAVVSVEEVTVSAFGTTATVNLTKGQDDTQCVPFYTQRHGAYTGDSDADTLLIQVEIIDNGGTAAIKLERVVATVTLAVTVYVVEFNSDITIQKIAHASVGASDVAWVASCTAVDQSKAFLLYSGKTSAASGTDDVDDMFIRVFFNSDTQIAIQRDYGAPEVGITGFVYVVEDTSGSHFDVQVVSQTITTVNQTVDAVIDSIDMATTMIIASTSSERNSGLGAQLDDVSILVRLLDATHVRMVANNFDCRIIVFVVTWKDGTSVQRGTKSIVTGTGIVLKSYAVPITLVDFDFSMVNPTWQSSHGYSAQMVTGGGFSQHQPCKLQTKLDADGEGFTVYQFNGTTNYNITLPWEVTEFEPVAIA